jgi:transposase
MEPIVKLEQPECLDDIPLIIHMAKQMNLPNLIDQHFPTHGNQQGLSNGKLCTGWLSFILSESNHCKNAVREWANKIPTILGPLLESKIRDVEFSDDRLANLLDTLSNDSKWNAFEETLSSSVIKVYDLNVETIRVDGSAACGYHDVVENGIMQFGYTKDHRPDLPQLKMMLATLDPGIPLAIDIVSGEKNDDILYTPLIQRVRKMIDKSGVLIIGDCKLSSNSIRKDIQKHQDYYLCPLSLNTEKSRSYFQHLVEAVVNGEQEASLIYKKKDDPKSDKTDYNLIGAGYEITRELEDEQKNKWNERVFVYRSLKFTNSEIEKLERVLKKVESELRKLTPKPQKNVKQYSDESKLIEAIEKIEKKYNFNNLFKITYITEPHKKSYRYVIEVERQEDLIKKRKYMCGWRPFVTNTLKENLSFQQAIETYLDEWTLERCFRMAKKSHLGISPLYLRKNERLKGITRLLSIGIRMMTLLEYQICKKMKENQDSIKGLDISHPNKTTRTPTVQSIFKKFCREKIMLSRAIVNGNIYWGMTQVGDILRKVLDYLQIPLEIYEVNFYKKWHETPTIFLRES